MKYQFRLALKNILRAKRRSVMTFIMLTFGVGVYIVMYGMMDGLGNKTLENLINFESGHFKIRNTHFDPDQPYEAKYFLTEFNNMEERIKKNEFVTGVTKRIHFLSEIDNGRDSFPIITIGIEVNNDRKVFTLLQFIFQGKLERGGTVIGESLAKDMHIQMGDMVFLTFRNHQNMYTSTELLVTGLMSALDPKVNNATALISLAEAQKYLSVNGVTEIAIKTNDYKKYESYEKILQKQISGADLKSWKKLTEDSMAIWNMKKSGQSIILVLIVIIALVGIINTLLMSVYEKKTEIGTLKALGMKDHEVRNLFIFEGLIIGFLGAFLGMIIGSLVNLYFVHYGVDWAAMFAGNDGKAAGDFGLNVIGVVKSTWSIQAYLSTFVLSMVASILASYYPAKKVSKLQPVECLRIH
jgi:putative ABC transport system permease protein